MEKRIDVFTRFLEEKRFNDIAIDGDQSDPMVKLLDSVVIFLEGGTDFDLEILDQELSEKAEEKMKMEEINKDNKELGEKSIGGEEVKKAEEEDNNADGTKNGADDANNDNDVKKEKNDNEGFSSFQKFMIITVSILITIVVLMIFGFCIWLKTGFQTHVNETVIAAQNP